MKRPSPTTLLLASLGINIFMGAFLLGKWSNPGFMPPPPFMHPRDSRPMPPPPFFGFAELLSPEERDDEMRRMDEHFKDIRALREDFAKELAAHPMSREAILAHFDAVDARMRQLRTQAQLLAAEKIAAMDDAERQAFAQRLLQDPGPGRPPVAPPPAPPGNDE